MKQNAHLLTAAELKRRGITRYDAEILLAQGVKLPEPRDIIQPLSTASMQTSARASKASPVKHTQRGKGGRFCKKMKRSKYVLEYDEMDSEVSSTNGSETDPWSLSASSAEIKENITSSPAARRRNYSGAKGFRSPPRGELFGTDDIIDFDFDDDVPRGEDRSRSRSSGRSSRANKKILTPVSKHNPTALVSPITQSSDDVKIGDTVPLSADKCDENSDAKSSNNATVTPRRASLRSSRWRSLTEQMPRLRKERRLSSPTRGSGGKSTLSPVRDAVLLRSASGSSSNGKPMPVLVKEEPSSSDETLPDKQENLALPQRLFEHENSSTSGETSDTMSSHSEFRLEAASKRNIFDDMLTNYKNYPDESASHSGSDYYDPLSFSMTKRKRSKISGSQLSHSFSDSKLPQYETQFTSDLALKIRNTYKNPSNPKKDKKARRFSENCYDSELVPQQDGKVPKITIRLRKGGTPSKNGEQDASISTTTELSAANSPGKSNCEPEYEIINNCDNSETEGNNNNISSNKRKCPSSPTCTDIKTGSIFSSNTTASSNVQQPKRIKIKFGEESVMDLHISPGKRKKIVEKVSS